jgi:isopenicillin N synthase-like dioxygenase
LTLTFEEKRHHIDIPQKLHTLSHHVLRALALVLKLPATYFEPFLANANPQLRLLHYMPIEKSKVVAAGHARINPHTDFGLCTILFQDSVGGLEVDPFHTGEFVPATPVPGTCVINVADLLQRLSNDKLRSTRHRVTAPKISEEAFEKLGEEGLLPARYSTAFFVHPSADVEIKPVLGEGEKCLYEPVNAGEWRTMHTAFNYALPVKAM